MAQKRYPFNAEKHAHDVELVKNRAKNLAYNIYMDGGDIKEAERLEKLAEEADELLGALFAGRKDWSGISWISGPMIGRAKWMVVLADEIRNGLNMQYRKEVHHV